MPKYKLQNVVKWGFWVELQCGHRRNLNPDNIIYSRFGLKDYFNHSRVRCELCGGIHLLQNMDLGKTEESPL